MIRRCSGDDPNLIGQSGGACACGREFDDVERSVIWPHAAIWSHGARKALIDRLESLAMPPTGEQVREAYMAVAAEHGMPIDQ